MPSAQQNAKQWEQVIHDGTIQVIYIVEVLRLETFLVMNSTQKLIWFQVVVNVSIQE